jgi:hypothetical protein
MIPDPAFTPQRAAQLLGDVKTENQYPSIPQDEKDRPLKHAEGKPMLHLIPAAPIHILARIYEWGINNKYRRNSWKEFSLEKAQDDLIPAAMRHIDAYREGEYLDPQTKLPHLAHAMWNLVTVLWHEIKYRGD